MEIKRNQYRKALVSKLNLIIRFFEENFKAISINLKVLQVIQSNLNKLKEYDVVIGHIFMKF